MSSKGKGDFIGTISILIGMASILLILIYFVPIVPIIGIIFGVIHVAINHKYGESGLGKVGIGLNGAVLLIYGVIIFIIIKQ